MATKKSTPDWGKLASERVTQFEKRFRDSLRRIAVRFAHHDRADTIDAKHVDEAYRALLRYGLIQHTWWKRPELKAGVAVALIGVAQNLPDWVPVFIESPAIISGVVIGGGIGLGISSATLWFWGWYQDRL